MIPFQIILESDSPIRVVTVFLPPEPPVVPPPLPPSPPADDSPFLWPVQPPYREATDPSTRYAGLGDSMYAGAPEYTAPTPSHWYAGRITTGHAGSWDLTGFFLWALPGTRPSSIRRALATGVA